jgi:hypothetical protein
MGLKVERRGVLDHRADAGRQARCADTDQGAGAQRNQKRRTLFDAQDKVEEQRDTLIAMLERKLTQSVQSGKLFVARWKLV